MCLMGTREPLVQILPAHGTFQHLYFVVAHWVLDDALRYTCQTGGPQAQILNATLSGLTHEDV